MPLGSSDDIQVLRQEILRERTLIATQAARDVLEERRRQLEGEGWSTQHDDTHTNGEMALAAAGYAEIAALASEFETKYPGVGAASVYADPPVPPFWPWDEEWWKPEDRRRDLVKAAALLLAEIERLDRAAAVAAGEAASASPVSSPLGERR